MENHFIKNIKLKGLKVLSNDDDDDNELLKERIFILIKEKKIKKGNKKLINDIDGQINQNKN